MTQIARATVDETVKESQETPELEDLNGIFFNKYGHKLNDIINSMSHKQIRRAVINAFGFQYKEYKPKPETTEGKLLWAMDRLVDTKLTMAINALYQEEERRKAKAEFDANSGLEDKILAQEQELIEKRNETQTEANASKEENNG